MCCPTWCAAGELYMTKCTHAILPLCSVQWTSRCALHDEMGLAGACTFSCKSDFQLQVLAVLSVIRRAHAPKQGRAMSQQDPGTRLHPGFHGLEVAGNCNAAGTRLELLVWQGAPVPDRGGGLPGPSWGKFRRRIMRICLKPFSIVVACFSAMLRSLRQAKFGCCHQPP